MNKDYKYLYMKYKNKYLLAKQEKLINLDGGGKRYLKNMIGSAASEDATEYATEANILDSQKLNELNDAIAIEKAKGIKFEDPPFQKLIEDCNKNNLQDERIENLHHYDVVQFPPQNFNRIVSTVITYELLHTGNNTNERPLYILPGFSNNSVYMTIGRINKYKEAIFAKGFTDIYIFNFTDIGKLPSLLEEKCGLKQSLTYHQISKHLSENLQYRDNVSLLGRSAGGGLALQMAFFYNNLFDLSGLNIACPGYDMDDMNEIIQNYFNKNLPIRLGWAKDDNKIFEKYNGQPLKNIFIDYGYTDFKYITVKIGNIDNEGKGGHIHTHRIQPNLIDDLV